MRGVHVAMYSPLVLLVWGLHARQTESPYRRGGDTWGGAGGPNGLRILCDWWQRSARK